MRRTHQHRGLGIRRLVRREGAAIVVVGEEIDIDDRGRSPREREQALVLGDGDEGAEPIAFGGDIRAEDLERPAPAAEATAAWGASQG